LIVLTDCVLSRTKFSFMNFALFMIYAGGYLIFGWSVYVGTGSFPYAFLDFRDPINPAMHKNRGAVAGVYVGFLVGAAASGLIMVFLSRVKSAYARRSKAEGSFPDST
jgi:hypothetical protein